MSKNGNFPEKRWTKLENVHVDFARETKASPFSLHLQIQVEQRSMNDNIAKSKL